MGKKNYNLQLIFQANFVHCGFNIASQMAQASCGEDGWWAQKKPSTQRLQNGIPKSTFSQPTFPSWRENGKRENGKGEMGKTFKKSEKMTFQRGDSSKTRRGGPAGWLGKNAGWTPPLDSESWKPIQLGRDSFSQFNGSSGSWLWEIPPFLEPHLQVCDWTNRKASFDRDSYGMEWFRVEGGSTFSPGDTWKGNCLQRASAGSDMGLKWLFL